MNIEIVLAQANFFRGMSPESRRRLAEIAIPRAARRRETIFREGDEGHALFLLNRGRVQLTRMGPDHTAVVIKTVRPGETFAEVVLFEQTRYPVTASALSDSMLFLFPRRDFRHLLRYDDFRDDFIAMLMRRQRFLAERIVEISTTDVEQRLFRFLREQFGDTPRVEPDVTKRDVAAAIGATPETLSRLLKRLEREGRLIWKGRRLLRAAPGRSLNDAPFGGPPTRESRPPSRPRPSGRSARPRSDRKA